jgi:hypothetical protein
MEKIKIHTMIEIAGKPEEHVKETIDKIINIIKENKKLNILKKEISSIDKTEVPSPSNPDQNVEIFSGFTELELELPNFDELIQFCFTFMPSSIEIIEPEELKISQGDLEASLGDLLGKLHENSRIIMEYQALKQQIIKAQQQRANEQKKN